MTCIIHAHVVNLASPGSYEKELNKMLALNGLPTIKTPSNVPSGAFLGAKMAEGMQYARSQESKQSEATGYQDEELMEMQPIQTTRSRSSSLQSLTKPTEPPTASTATQLAPTTTSERVTSMGEEEIPDPKQHPRDPRKSTRKTPHAVDASSLGLIICTSESQNYPNIY